MRKKITTSKGYIFEGEFYKNGKLKKGKSTYRFSKVFEDEFYENGELKIGVKTYVYGESKKVKIGKELVDIIPYGEVQHGKFDENGKLKTGAIRYRDDRGVHGIFLENGVETGRWS